MLVMSGGSEFHLSSPSATRALGASLAALVRPGDVIGLTGDLGAGKTELARGLIAALAGDDVEVPSPTFNLVLTYDTPQGTVWHFDLYRVEQARELRELGLEDAFDTGISIIEWPDRLGAQWPHWGLMVTLAQEGEGRRATLAGGGDWPERLKALKVD
jgi:tRNA threonylcarbamoyladenosine biosynthesis protein TsaE